MKVLMKKCGFTSAGSLLLFLPFIVSAQENVSEIIEDWPNKSRKAAEDMIEKYGQPEEYTSSLLIWRDNGPWKKTVVYDKEVDHNFPIPHKDVLEQFIKLDVPADYFDDLAKYDGSVIAERTKGILSARCDKEPMNFPALNLAYDIVNEKRSVEGARDFYAQTAAAFMRGDEHEYTQKLLFTPGEDTGDPDEVMIGEAVEGVIEGADQK